MNSMASLIFSNLVTASPQLVIAVVGLILVHKRLKGVHSKAYFHGNVGLVLLLMNGLWRALTQTYIQSARLAQERHPIELANMTSFFSVVGFAIFTATLIFMLAAIIADREPGKNSRAHAA
jgi:hypothetical protein